MEVDQKAAHPSAQCAGAEAGRGDRNNGSAVYRHHALAYAQVGLEVLPLRPRQKTPLTAHGKDDATTDPGQIAAWWNRWPNANIGIRPPIGLVVIDVDPRNGGDGALSELSAAQILPATWTCRTGSGGRHIWLRHSGPIRGKLCAGVDLKGNAGYLVVPPSVHPNGARYQWANAEPIAYAPQWLRPLLAPAPRPIIHSSPTHSGSTSAALVRAVAYAGEGNRNGLLYWAARTAAEEGILPNVRDELAAAALSTGLPAHEIDRTLRSAAQKAVRR